MLYKIINYQYTIIKHIWSLLINVFSNNNENMYIVMLSNNNYHYTVISDITEINRFSCW
jgi:hypothetical protein